MKNIETMKELNNFIKNNNNVALQFLASWCGPCNKFKERVIEEYMVNEKLKKISFGLCDIDNDEFEDLIDLFNIKSIPTVIFVKLENKTVVEKYKMEGYDWILFESQVSNFLNEF